MYRNNVARALLLLAIGLLASGAASPHEAPGEPIRTLTAVRGETGRPQIWRYRRGEKQVWILGSVATIPRDTAFDASEINRTLAGASAIVGPPGHAIGDNIGVLRALTLWSSIRREKFNKDGGRLSAVLPPETYARWNALKSELDAGDVSDRLRPMYAAYALFQAASRQMGIGDMSPASALLQRTAKQLGRDVIDARFHLPVSDARATVAAFEVSRSDDIICLERTMTAIERLRSHMPQLRDAWATGDIEELEEATRRNEAVNYCWATLTNQAIGRAEGIADLSSEMDESWLQTLHSALAEGDTVFTLLPVADLIAGRGPVALLLQEGFVLQEPAAALQSGLR